MSSTKIGLIADTHMPGAIEHLWPEALAFFEGCDAILHAGDLHTLPIVDTLSEIAPTYVALGNGDIGMTDPRLKSSWRLDFEGTIIGMMHHCPSPARKPETVVMKAIQKRFETPPNILIFGHTHAESVTVLKELVLVNPGSPTLPNNRSLRRGTLGMIELMPSAATIALHQITEAGVVQHPTIAPLTWSSTTGAISV